VRGQFGDVLVCSTQNLVAPLRTEPEARPDFQLVDLLGQLVNALRTQAGSVVPDEGEEMRGSADRGGRRAFALEAALGRARLDHALQTRPVARRSDHRRRG